MFCFFEKRLIAIGFALTTLCWAGATPLWAVPLQLLLDGESITAGGVRFSGWRLDAASDAAVGFQPDFQRIDVEPIESSGSAGLRFSANGQWATVGDAFVDTFFQYSVEPVSDATTIAASELTLSGFEINGAGGAVNIVQEVVDQQGMALALGAVFSDRSTGRELRTDRIGSAARGGLRIDVAVLVSGGFDQDQVRLDQFEQTFRVGSTVPQPATWSLLALSAAAVLKRRVKREELL